MSGQAFPMRSVIVLSTPQQLETFLRMEKTGQISVFCDNESLYSLLEKKGIIFEKLDEFLIRDQWAAMNSWGCGKASGWIQLCRNLTPAKEPDVLPGFFTNFSVLLITALKNHAFAEHIMTGTSPSSVYVFDPEIRPAFPDFSGNAFLNYFLKAMSVRKGIPLQILLTSSEGCDCKRGFSGSLSSVVRFFIKRILAFFFIRRPGKDKKLKKYLLVDGSLRHLGAMVDFLHRKGVPIIFFDDEFHADLFCFSAKRGIRYVTADRLPSPSQEAIIRKRETLRAQLMTKFFKARQDGFFKYEECDFSDFIQVMVLGDMTTYLDGVAKE